MPNEVRAAIERAGRMAFLLWESCGRTEARVFLEALAKEDEVMRLMAQAMPSAKKRGYSIEDASATLLALAKECER